MTPNNCTSLICTYILPYICYVITASPVTNHPLFQASLVDSMNENASNCSWEAVDERSAPSSGANSSQQITSSVLWVPDHAVSRCTTCQTEFWLGRRKHHCRSCGQIFCADCSEYWAPLSDGKLFQTVRLCGPCYQNVCGKMAVGDPFGWNYKLLCNLSSFTFSE